jgi:hypothetical protein
MPTNIINIFTSKTLCPLYYRYPYQLKAQTAYIQLTEDGDITSGYSTEIGNGETPDVRHRCTIRWYVAPEISGKSLVTILESDEFHELYLKVWNGHSIEFDNIGNRIGILDDEAREADKEIKKLISELCDCVVEIWPVDEYIFSSNNLLGLWRSGPASISVAKIKASALSQNIHIDGNVLHCLLQEAMDYVHELVPGLTGYHLDELIRNEYIDQNSADKYAMALLT